MDEDIEPYYLLFKSLNIVVSSPFCSLWDLSLQFFLEGCVFFGWGVLLDLELIGKGYAY